MIGIASLMIGFTLWLPLWRIEIWAPQYPEGLVMHIMADQMTGNIDQVNILNHYIGMKKIAPESIPELSILPWVLGALTLCGLLIALTGKRAAVIAWLASFAAAGAVGFVDFYLWGYDYGHNLNPEAPIKIPGLTYQPPLIGHKTLLNVDSYSLPDAGSYLLLIAFLIAIIALVRDKTTRNGRPVGPLRPIEKSPARALITGLGCVLSSILILSCTSKPEALHVGSDDCAHCHMKITDPRFGGEIITKKGRIYKFDALSCLLNYYRAEEANIKDVFVLDFLKPGSFIDAKNAFYMDVPDIRAPMGGPLAGSDRDSLLRLLKKPGTATVKTWRELETAKF